MLRSLLLTLCLFGSAGCWQQVRPDQNEDVAAYQVVVRNESEKPFRYRYSRLVPHQPPTTPVTAAPTPQPTIDIGVVFETVAPGQEVRLSLKPGKKLTLLTSDANKPRRYRIEVDSSMLLRMTSAGLYRQNRSEDILIQVNE